MDAKRVDELRDRASHVGSQIGVLEQHEKLLTFFQETTAKIATAGCSITIQEDRARIYKHRVLTEEFDPTWGVDRRAQLWRALTDELAVELDSLLTRLLRKYTTRAMKLRNAALCEVCGVEDTKTTTTRKPRGVKLRNKEKV